MRKKKLYVVGRDYDREYIYGVDKVKMKLPIHCPVYNASFLTDTTCKARRAELTKPYARSPSTLGAYKGGVGWKQQLERCRTCKEGRKISS